MGLSLKKRLTDNFLTRGASRAFDQANVFDDGRSWQQRTPTVKQSVGGQVRNIFDANNKADVASRVSQGQPTLYRDQQQLTRRDNVQSVEENPFKRVYQEAVEAPRRIGFGLARNTTQQAETDQSTLSYQQTRDNVLLNAQKKIKDPFTPVAERQRLVKYLQSEYPQAQQDDFNTRLELERNVKDADPVAGLAALAEMGVDVATLGMGGVVFKGSKQAAKQGFKQAVKYTAKNIIKPVVPAAVGGALGAVTSQGSDVTPQQIAMGAGAGAALGVAFPAVGTLVGTGSKAINAKIPTVEAMYDPKAKPKVTLKNSPKLDPLESLKQEARKYRSAEEFVAAQQRLLHGSRENIDQFDLNHLNATYMHDGLGVNFTDNQDFAKLYSRGKNQWGEINKIDDGKGVINERFMPNTKALDLTSGDMVVKDVLSFDDFKTLAKEGRDKDWARKNLERNARNRLMGATDDSRIVTQKVASMSDDELLKVAYDGLGSRSLKSGDGLPDLFRQLIDVYGITDADKADVVRQFAKVTGTDYIKSAKKNGSVVYTVLNPDKLKTKQQLTDLYNQATQSQPPKSPLTVEKNVAPNPEPLPVVKPKVELKAPDQIKSAQKQTLESIAEKPKVSLKEKNNLGDALNLDRFKNPQPVDLPKLDTNTQIGKLSDDDMVRQMVNDLGVSESTARKLIAENNKPALAQNLYGSKELIRNANNSDAYATKIMSEAQKRSGQAAKQNMPVVKMKDGTSVNTLTGEIIEPITKESTFAKQLKEAYAKTEKEFQELDKKVGFGEDEIREKMIRAARGDYKLTSAELEASKFYTDRLNLAKAVGEENGLVVKGDQKLYTPQSEKGRVGKATTVDEVMDFGYNKSRKNAIELDEMDYSKDPQVDYVVKAENRPLIVQKAIDDAAKIDGRIVPEENVVKAADKVQQLQKKVHDSSKSAKVLTNDTVTDLNDIGKLEGYEQKTIDYSPGAIVQEPKVMLEKAGIYKNGFEQYENAAGYGNEFARQVKEYNLSPEQTIEGLEKSIRKSMPGADNSAVNSAVANARRRLAKENLSPEDAAHIYQSAFKNVAKSELFRLGKTTSFSNNKLRKVVNEQINTRLMVDAWNKNAAQNLDSFMAERINVSLRGMNIVSALFEMGDMANIYSKYGFDDVANSKFGFGKIDGDSLHASHKYGQNSPHYLSADIPEISKFEEIISNPNWSVGKKVYEMYRTTENKFLFFKYIEQHKTEMFFRAAEADYMKKGLRGTELVNAVMEDYYKTMLPHSVLTANRIVGKFPKVMTQYLNWSLQATKRMGRTLSGSDEGGAFAGKTRAERVARGIGTEIVPKVGIAALLGVPIMQVLGMRDMSGATEGDFTGIDDEDKIAADYAVDALSISPLLGVAGNFYFADRRNDIAQQKAEQGETYGAEPRESDKPVNVAKDSANMLIPFKTQYNKSKQVIDAARQGYYANKDGKIQAEGPKGAELAMGVVTGKNYTPTFREYQDNPNIVSVLQGKNKPQDLIVKNETVSNVVQSFGGESTRNFKRPLNQEYSDAFKTVDKSLRTAMLDGGRKYNAVLDDLKRSDRNAYDSYITSMDGNHVSPEYWKQLTGGSAGSDVDLKLFNSMKARKQQLYNDMTKAGQNKDGKYNVDPLYSLKDEQARQVLQMKSTATGDDLALRNILYKEKWYTDYINKQSEYYKNKPEGPEGDYESTPRVKEWYKHNDAYNALTGVTGDTLQKSYPLVWQLKQYEFGSEDSKNFLKNNYDAWKAQNDALDASKLALINKMRNIEGYDPMSADAYAQATEVADTSDTADNSWGSSGSKDNTPTAAYTKVPQGETLGKVSFKSSSPEIRTKKSVKRRPRPKLQLKKSMV